MSTSDPFRAPAGRPDGDQGGEPGQQSGRPAHWDQAWSDQNPVGQGQDQPSSYGQQPGGASPYGQPQQGQYGQSDPQPYGGQQYGQPQYGQPEYGQPWGPVSRKTNGMAIASMVLGIVWLYWLGSIVALVFGYIARNQMKRSGEGGGGMAIAGIVLGYVGLAFLLLVIGLGVSGVLDDPYGY